MTIDLCHLRIWFVAYAAAGAFYVARGLGRTRMAVSLWELPGLASVALCWAPIIFGDFHRLRHSVSPSAALGRLKAEGGAPLALLLTIIAAAGRYN